MKLAAGLLAVLFLTACGGAGSQRPLIRAHGQDRYASLRYQTAAAPVVGEVLSTTNGAWTNAPTGYSYQWERCSPSCANITSATTSSYTVQSADLGDTIDVIVTASNAAGSASQTSAPTGVVTSGVAGATPIVATQPKVSGSFQQGQTLTTTNGTWSNTPTGYSYQWERCNLQGVSCATIAGTTASTYTTVLADKGDSIRSIVTASNAGGSGTLYSNATGVITGPCTTTYTYAQASTSLSAAVAGAAAGTVFCISTAGTAQISIEAGAATGMTYIEPAPGAALQTANWRVDNGGGNVTIENFTGPNPGGYSVVCTGGSGTCTTTGVDFLNNVLPGGEISIENTEANGSFYVARNLMYGCGTTCDNSDSAFLNAGQTSSPFNCPNGITFAHNSGITTADDGMSTNGGACGTKFDSNDIENIVETFCSAIHCDGFQDNGGGSTTTLDGNYLNNTQDCWMLNDGSDSMTFTNNACVNSPDSTYSEFQGGSTTTFITEKHNTLMVGTGGDLSVDHGAGNCAGTATANPTVTDNIEGKPITDVCGGTGLNYPPSGTITVGFNDCPGGTAYYCAAGGTNLAGTPTFIGGATPATNGGGQTATWGALTATDGTVTPGSWTNLQLTTGSIGHNAADDATDMGVPASYFQIGTTQPSGTLPGIGG